MIKFKKGGIVESIATFKTRWTLYPLRDDENGCEVLRKLITKPLLALAAGSGIGLWLSGFVGIYYRFVHDLVPDSLLIFIGVIPAILTLGGGLFFLGVCGIIYTLDKLGEKVTIHTDIKDNISEYYNSFKDKYCPKVEWKD
jgi:hypothetical protein